MKILFVLLFISISIFGQSFNNRQNKFSTIERTLSKILEDSNSVLIEQIIQYWNGADWVDQNKTLIKYNQIGLKENEKIFGWNGVDWEEYKRTFYTYNLFHKVEAIFIEEYFLEWDTTVIASYKYDDVGREIEETVKSWNNDEGKYVQWKLRTSYINNNISEEINQLFESELWINWNKTIYKYDLKNNLTERLVQFWENNNWVNNSSYNFLFDEEGSKIKSIQLFWSNSVWDTLNMHSFIYNENSQLIEENRKVKQEGVWIDDSKFSYSYNSDGKIVFHMFQYWADMILLNGNRNYYEYNVDGKISQEIEQGWRNDNWENNSKVNYIYDLKGNLINKIYNNWTNGTWTNTVQYLYTYDEVTNIRKNDYSTNYFELANNYPNPFNPSTTIKYSIPKTSKVRLSIYTVLGEEVTTLVDHIQNQGVYEVIFNANSLASGVYIYRINVGNEYSEVKKMLLLK